MITLVPIGGLCNRMRAIASGVYISRSLKIPLEIVWRKDSTCYAHFNDLFIDDVFFNEVSCENNLHGHDAFVNKNAMRIRPFRFSDFYLSYSRKANLYIPGLIRNFIFDTQITGKCENLSDNVSYISGRSIYIISGYSISKHYPINDIFKPRPELMLRINELTSGFSNNTVGVHIRRGDNILAIAKNSIDDFFCLMDRKIMNNNDVNFYLATDSDEVRVLAIKRYGNRILHNNSVLSRKSLEGMKDAVVDLWSLAGCEEILGSYNSSFSDMAISLKGCHPFRET